MTALDIPGLVLPSRWQMIGVLEAVNGALLFGISTAQGLTVRQRQLGHAISQYRDSVRIREVLLIRLPVAAP